MRYVRKFEKFNIQTVVGLLIFSKSTKRILLIQRSDGNKYWSILTGGVDKKDKNDYETIRRELGEELRFFDIKKIKIKKIKDELSSKRHFKFFYGEIDDEFDVILDDENISWGWFSIDGPSIINGQFNSFGLPNNLYPGLSDKITKTVKQ